MTITFIQILVQFNAMHYFHLTSKYLNPQISFFASNTPAPFLSMNLFLHVTRLFALYMFTSTICYRNKDCCLILTGIAQWANVVMSHWILQRCLHYQLSNTIVNRGEMVRKPGKHQRCKQRGQDLVCKVHDRAHLLFCAHALCMNYVIAMFLLVSCMNTRNHQLYFVRFCARFTPKIANKNLKQRTLPGFLTISLY